MNTQRMTMGAALCLLCACGTGPIDAVDLDLVAHWTFDEGRGDKVRDSSPNHFDGTINGSTWSWVPNARFNAGLHLEQGDYLTVDNFPNATRSWTVSAWIWIASQDADKGDMTIVSTEDVYKGGWELNIMVLSTADGTGPQYHFGYYVGPGPVDYDHSECAGFIKMDSWQHVTAVLDGSAKTLTMYLGDVAQPPVTIRQVISPGVPTLYMGRWATTDPARLLVGSLDDISLWNRALGPEEVAALTRSPAP